MGIPSRELTFTRRGVRFQIVDLAGVGSARGLPAAVEGDGSGTPDVRYVIESWTPAWGVRADRYRVTRDGCVRYLGSSIGGLADWLRADVDEQASRRSGTALVVRGDAVVWRGRAILLLRPGRVGISLLTTALLDCGAARCAERIAVIDDAGRIHGAGVGVDHTARAPLALVVATTYRPGSTWQSRTVKGARAALPFIDSIRSGAPADVLRRAARVAPQLITLQGRRGEAVDAAPHLLAAVDELLDGASAARPGSAAARWLARARGALARQQATAADAHEGA